jgi:hypothetical protein
LNPCPTYHDTWKDYQARVVEIGPEHDPADTRAAFELIEEQERVPIGVIFKQDRPTFGELSAAPSDRKLELKKLFSMYR